MEEKKNIPKLRFPDFDDAWEHRKLGELVSFSKGSGYSKGDLKETGTPIILYGRLYTKYETVISNVDTFVDVKKGSVYSKGGEVIVPASGETAEDISIASVVEKSGILLGGDLNVITPQDNLDSAFLAITISNGKPHNDMAKMAQGKSVVHLHNSDLAKIDLLYPCMTEQQIISKFFSDIDNLITLQQRKCIEIKNLKKCILQKMFPKEGEKFPEIRFPGFTDAWEQRKLPEFVDFFSGLTYTPDDVREEGTLVLRSSNVKDGEIIDADNVYVNTAVSKSENVQVGDIIVVVRNGSRALIGKHAEIKQNMPNTVIGAFMSGIRSEQPAFVNALLDTPRFAKEIEKNMGATINQITGYMFAQMEFMIPSLSEQKQIGDFFRNIDNLIALQQRKCEKLKYLKKSLLQQMFV